jgi:hypothetical protein
MSFLIQTFVRHLVQIIRNRLIATFYTLCSGCASGAELITAEVLFVSDVATIFIQSLIQSAQDYRGKEFGESSSPSQLRSQTLNVRSSY